MKHGGFKPMLLKGIWRDELPLAKYMFDVILMDCIKEKLLSWYIGERNQKWNVNVGKCGKMVQRNTYLMRFIMSFISIYPTIDYEEMWQSLFRAGVNLLG